MSDPLPTTYKGIRLDMWKSPKLIAALTTKEMCELHLLLQMHILEDIERRLQTSDFAEASSVIARIKDTL